MPVSRKPRGEPEPSASPTKRAKAARGARDEAERTIHVASSAPPPSQRKRRNFEVEESDGDGSFVYARPPKRRRDGLDDGSAEEERKRRKREKKNKRREQEAREAQAARKQQERLEQEAQEQQEQQKQLEQQERSKREEQDEVLMSGKKTKRQKTYKGRSGRRKAKDEQERMQSSPSGQLLFEASQQPVEAMDVIEESEQEDIREPSIEVPEEGDESEQEELEEYDQAEAERSEQEDEGPEQEDEESEQEVAEASELEDGNESDREEVQDPIQEEIAESEQEEVDASEHEETATPASAEESEHEDAAVPSINGVHTSLHVKRSSKDQSMSKDEIPTSAQKMPKKRRDKKKQESPPAIAETDPSGSEDIDASDLPSSGAFTAKEIKIMRRFVKDFIKANGMTQDAFNDIVQDRKVGGDAKKVWNGLAQSLPHRNRKALQRGMRVRYHNFGARGKWTADEDEKLREAYDVKPQKWTYIGGMVGRMPEDCKDRWRNLLVYGDNRRKYTWSTQEEAALRAAVAECMDLLCEAAQAKRADGKKPSAEEIGMSNISWGAVSDRMNSTRSRLQCYTKWQNMTKAG